MDFEDETATEYRITSLGIIEWNMSAFKLD